MSNDALTFQQPESLTDWKVAPMLSTMEDYDKLLGIMTVQAVTWRKKMTCKPFGNATFLK
jgi:hypothetical protein